MKILNTALVGLGRIGWKFHLAEIVKNPGFKLIAVVDPVQERLDEAETLHSAKGFTDCESLFDSGIEIDLVVIASPTVYHKEQALLAFKNGCDVFCDKPMTVSFDEAEEIFNAVKTLKRKFMVYQPHRATKEFLALQHILTLDLIGSVYMIKRTSTGYTRRNDWQSLTVHGGGMLNNYGAHFLDQLLHITSSKIDSILCACLQTVISVGDAEDFVKLIMKTDNGIVLDMEINMASAHSMPTWHIAGTRGSIILNQEKTSWHVRYIPENELEEVELQEGLAAQNREYGNGTNLNWKEDVFEVSSFEAIDYYSKCYDYFALDQPPFVPIEETMEIMRVFKLCREKNPG